MKKKIKFFCVKHDSYENTELYSEDIFDSECIETYNKEDYDSLKKKSKK